MSKKYPPPELIDGGAPCPKCRQPMQRCQHSAVWQPRPDQAFYFEYWDKCRRCHHIQHYEAAKVYTTPQTQVAFERQQLAAIEEALDRVQLAMFDETGRPELPLAPRVTTRDTRR